MALHHWQIGNVERPSETFEPNEIDLGYLQVLFVNVSFTMIMR